MCDDNRVVILESELAELRSRLAEADSTIERLRAGIDSLTAALAGDTEAARTKYAGMAQGLPAELRTGLASILAAQFRDMLGTAENYVEMLLGDDIGQMTVTIQKVEGKTPHQFRRYAERRLEKWRNRARQLALHDDKRERDFEMLMFGGEDRWGAGK